MEFLVRARPFALAAILAVLVPACRGGDEGTAGAGPGPGDGPRPAFVELMTVEPRAFEDGVTLVGQLEAEEEVVIRPEIAGVVEDFFFEEGDRVDQGALLFKLRDDEQQAALEMAEAKAGLAADSYRRTNELAEQQVVSEAELVRVTRELELARAEARRAKVELDRTEIRAPFAGVLGARRVSPGETVRPEKSELVSLTKTDRLRLVYTVPERAIPIVHQGMPVEVRVANLPGESFSGKTYFVAPALIPETRRLLLKAWIPNGDGNLKPGQFANIDTVIRQEKRAIVLPEESVVRDQKGPFVWRVGEQRKAQRADVELGVRQEGRVEVTRGVDAGDVIVVAGTNKVSSGQVVRESPLAKSAGARSTEGAPAPESGS